MERNYNRGSKCGEIESGDWVWLRNDARSNSLSPLYRGPWLVVDRQGVNLRLSDLKGKESQYVHLNRCKKADHFLPYGSDEDRSSEAREGSYRSTRVDLNPTNDINIETTRVPVDGEEISADASVRYGQDGQEPQLPDSQDDREIVGLRRSSRIRKEPDRYGEWS